MATNAERQRAFSQRQRDAGMVKLSVWVPATQHADARNLLLQLGSDSDLELGPLRNVRTGKFRKKGG